MKIVSYSGDLSGGSGGFYSSILVKWFRQINKPSNFNFLVVVSNTHNYTTHITYYIIAVKIM